MTIREIEDRTVRINVRNQVQFLDLAAGALGDELLGFHLAQDVDLRELGLFHYVMASSELLGDALRRAERYSTIVNEGVSLKYLEDNDVSMVFNYVGVARHSDRHQIEAWTVVLIRICRELTRRRLVPACVKFAHRRSDDPSEFNNFLGVPATFGADVDEVAFCRSCKHISVVGADPYLNELLLTYCEEALSYRRTTGGPLRIQVENAIVPILPHREARADKVASRLGMSSRTLARRLSSEGHTFAGVLDNLRSDLAERYLSDGDLSISQIAWLLGYQEVSAFTRAYKRWTGKTPRQMRS